MKALSYERGGVRFSVRETGEGPAMVFQHGLCGDAGQPAEVFPADIGWRCAVLECRGHGRSEAGSPEEFSLSTFAGDVISWIDARESAPVVLGGISMGAAIALRLAVLNPASISALVLARPAWIDERAPANMQPNALVGDLLGRYPPDEARSRFENSEMAHKLAIEAPDNLASLLGFFSRRPLATTRELLRRISGDGPGISRDQIAAIRQPALVIGTARDFVHPLAKAKELAALIPNATMVEITPKSDSRDAYRRDFRAALSAFLKRL
jgi:pimeloyl-ACP methyl ester carboxylesterase